MKHLKSHNLSPVKSSFICSQFSVERMIMAPVARCYTAILRISVFHAMPMVRLFQALENGYVVTVLRETCDWSKFLPNEITVHSTLRPLFFTILTLELHCCNYYCWFNCERTGVLPLSGRLACGGAFRPLAFRPPQHYFASPSTHFSSMDEGEARDRSSGRSRGYGFFRGEHGD